MGEGKVESEKKEDRKAGKFGVKYKTMKKDKKVVQSQFLGEWFHKQGEQNAEANRY
ncbi:MAG TPA: hypothetical protein PK354_07090 [bacterium]|nr:hypothetical protein [bacterium]